MKQAALTTIAFHTGTQLAAAQVRRKRRMRHVQCSIDRRRSSDPFSTGPSERRSP